MLKCLDIITKYTAFGFVGASIACAACLVSAQPSKAGTIDWAYWNPASVKTSNTSGGVTALLPLTGITATYTGEIQSLQLDYPSWTPTSTYADGSIVSNAPPQAGNIIQLFGATGATDTVTFSQPVLNPVMAIWSLGQSAVYGDSNIDAEFDFASDEPFSVVAGGPSLEYMGQSITSSGEKVYGLEGNGTIQFTGTYSSLTWTNPVFENWYGFTVGAPVPLPSSLPVVAIGLIGVIAWRTLRSSEKLQQI